MRQNPAERLARLMLVAELLRNDPQVMRNVQHERITVTEFPDPRRVRVLQLPPGRHRIIDAQIDPRQLPLRGQHIRIILTELVPPDLHRPFEQHFGRIEGAGRDQTTRTVKNWNERGRLRHVRHAPPFARPAPHSISMTTASHPHFDPTQRPYIVLSVRPTGQPKPR